MMKKQLRLRPRAALLVGAAFLATPALAQETVTDPQTATPPPVVVAPPPPTTTVPETAPAPAPQIQMAPQSPIVQPAPPPGPRPVAETEAEAPAAAERSARARETRTVTRARTTQTARAAAPAPVQPAAAPEPAAPVATAQPAPEAPLPEVATAPDQSAPPAPVVQTEQRTQSTDLNWSWIVGGALALIAAIAAAMLMMRRRKPEEELYVAEESAPVEPVYPAYEERVVATDPRREVLVDRLDTREPRPMHDYAAAVAPAAAAAAAYSDEPANEASVEAELADADSAELAGVADAPAPVANRPWLEFGLRPVRAGTNEEEALVDVELTVGNAGDIPARDVRISTFMLADAEDGEMERMLTGRGGDAAVPPVTIDPGDGTRVDAHLAVPKGELGRTFNPVVVAEARYTLPDGREGRTSAAFRIGRSAPDVEGVGPIGATRPHIVEDVEAELFGVPEHA